MQNIQSLISQSIKTLYGVDFSPEISPAPKPELGEYCVNIFPIVKEVGKAPNIISEEVAKALSKNSDIFKGTSATGGYVNFFLTDTVWMDIFRQLPLQREYREAGRDFVSETTEKNPQSLRDSSFTKGAGKTIIVDYIGMNVGKPPHIGHICTPLQGQSIINTLRYLGYKVIGDSHLGDWGSLFGKLIVGFRKYGDATRLHEDAINHLLEVYIAINTDIESDSTIEQECRDAFRELSSGNPAYTKIWAEFTSASIDTNKKILELMHIHQDYDIGESFYEGIDLPKIGEQPPLEYDMDDIVEELIGRGIATANEDGSVGVIFPEEIKMPSTILRKKDGTNLYLTSDLAAIKYRLTNGWNPSRILYFVDVRQSLHLKQAFWIAKTAWPELAAGVELFHAANGAIVLPEGAMSTRKGNIIRLDALVEEGFVRVKNILEEKGRHLSDRDITEITVAAIKYSYLSQDRERDVVFTWDKALNFEGNSGPYIQYAYVRANKINEQGTMNNEQGGNPQLLSVNCSLGIHDKSLIQKLAEFDGKVEEVGKKYKPHHLALYAYDLAVVFNSFYVHTPKILEEKDEALRNFRLALVAKTAETLKTAFSLLAIEMPSEM